MLEVTTIEVAKYCVAVFPHSVQEAMKDNTEIQASKHGIFADAKMRLPMDIADAMLKSYDIKGPELMQKKGNLIT